MWFPQNALTRRNPPTHTWLWPFFKFWVGNISTWSDLIANLTLLKQSHKSTWNAIHYLNRSFLVYFHHFFSFKLCSKHQVDRFSNFFNSAHTPAFNNLFRTIELGFRISKSTSSISRSSPSLWFFHVSYIPTSQLLGFSISSTISHSKVYWTSYLERHLTAFVIFNLHFELISRFWSLSI